jgi:hypothetical protein
MDGRCVGVVQVPRCARDDDGDGGWCRSLAALGTTTGTAETALGTTAD